MHNTQKPAVLLIHGFTAHRSSLEAIIPGLDKRKITWHYPILAGHGTRPRDMKGKTWQHWQKDTEMGLNYLLQENSQIVIIAMSMGALLALELAAKFPKKVTGLVLLSPALHFKNKVTRFTPVVKKVMKWFPNPSYMKFSSLKYAKNDLGYRWIPTEAFHSYWLRTKHFDSVLEKVYQSVKIIHSKKDWMASPSGAQHIYNIIPSHKKQLIWLDKSGHEVLLDAEVETVLKHIFLFKHLQ